MVSQTNEQALEAAIEKCLTGTCLEQQKLIADGAAEVPFSDNHGYQLGLAHDFNAHYALDTKKFWAFLEKTQSEELEKLQKSGADWQRKVLERFDRLIKKYGLLYLLKKGLSVDDAHLNLMYPAPLASSSELVKQRFADNVFSSSRQVRYSLSNTLEEIDLVLFINGLPFATLELKNPWTGQAARYHQLDVVRQLIEHSSTQGVGHTYLIQHSAGSGKSNSITWAAYQLIEVYPETLDTRGAKSLDEPLFDSVIVVTDRRLLDRQLRDNIKEFSEVKNIIAPALKSSELKSALERVKLNHPIELDYSETELDPQNPNPRGAYGGDEQRDPLDDIIRSFNERWFQGWPGTSEEKRVKLFSIAKKMQNHADFEEKYNNNQDIHTKDLAFAKIFDEVLLQNRRDELELYKLLAKDPAFKAAMQQSLRRIISVSL